MTNSEDGILEFLKYIVYAPPCADELRDCFVFLYCPSVKQVKSIHNFLPLMTHGHCLLQDNLCWSEPLGSRVLPALGASLPVIFTMQHLKHNLRHRD